MAKGLLNKWKKGIGSGWFKESRRHALASKGIKTGTKSTTKLLDFGVNLSKGKIGYAKRTLTVQKKAHHRKGYVKDVKPGPGKIMKRIAPTRVKKSKKFKIKDIGAKGRGKKVIKRLRKGKMTDIALKLGYIQQGERISDIPSTRFDDFAEDLAKQTTPRTALRMLVAQKVFRIRQPNGFKKKVEIGIKALKDKYESELAPKEAIQARLKMGKSPGRG